MFPIFWIINDVLFDPFIWFDVSNNVVIESGLPCEYRINFPGMFCYDGFVGPDNGWNRTRFWGNVWHEFVFMICWNVAMQRFYVIVAIIDNNNAMHVVWHDDKNIQYDKRIIICDFFQKSCDILHIPDIKTFPPINAESEWNGIVLLL